MFELFTAKILQVKKKKKILFSSNQPFTDTEQQKKTTLKFSYLWLDKIDEAMQNTMQNI